MRLIFALTLLFSLPVLVVAHRQHYSTRLQGPLLMQLGMALDAPEFAQVKATLNFMDVTLQGRVADLESRERAQKLADDIRGLRCRAQDNLLHIGAKLSGKLTDKKLAISGWLHDEVVLSEVTHWLASARPGIEISTDEVHLSPHVTVESAPGKGSVPPPFRAAWAAIEVPSSLTIAREGGKFTIGGYLAGAAVKDAVILAMSEATPPGMVDAARLESGVYVHDAKFATEDLLPSFLKTFFGTPGAARFEADAKEVRVTGNATPTMQREWMELLEPISREATLQAQFQVFPSVFHFPGRVRESKIEGEALTVLQEVLGACAVDFGPGYTTADSVEQPKISAAASAIMAAGPDVRIVAGGHVDLVGDPKNNLTMARRRAEGVVADLVSKGVSPQVVESAVFEAVPDGADHSRQVELIIK